MRNYDEEECDWGRERGGEKKRGRVRISEIITEATSPRAYCTVQKVASRTHTRTHIPCQVAPLSANFSLCRHFDEDSVGV